MASLKTLAHIVFPLLFLLIAICDASNNVVVGGHNGWKVPSAPGDLNKWAEPRRFQVGDYLIFNYDKNVDSVLVVTQEDYNNCNTTNPITKYTDGSSKVLLDTDGSHFYISGANGQCPKGQKLHVVVLSDDHGKKPDASAPEPAAWVAPMPGKSGAADVKSTRFMGVFGVFAFVVTSLVLV
ncbi:hypothetical protein ACFE04_010425 [Oxalis oulophora]